LMLASPSSQSHVFAQAHPDAGPVHGSWEGDLSPSRSMQQNRLISRPASASSISGSCCEPQAVRKRGRTETMERNRARMAPPFFSLFVAASPCRRALFSLKLYIEKVFLSMIYPQNKKKASIARGFFNTILDIYSAPYPCASH